MLEILTSLTSKNTHGRLQSHFESTKGIVPRLKKHANTYYMTFQGAVQAAQLPLFGYCRAQLNFLFMFFTNRMQTLAQNLLLGIFNATRLFIYLPVQI